MSIGLLQSAYVNSRKRSKYLHNSRQSTGRTLLPLTLQCVAVQKRRHKNCGCVNDSFLKQSRINFFCALLEAEKSPDLCISLAAQQHNTWHYPSPNWLMDMKGNSLGFAPHISELEQKCQLEKERANKIHTALNVHRNKLSENSHGLQLWVPRSDSTSQPLTGSPRPHPSRTRP